MQQNRLAFIGAGNMAASIIGGLLDQGQDAALVRASDPSEERREYLQSAFGVQCCSGNSEAVVGADAVILAVKPQVMREVTRDIRDAVAESGTLVISIAAGVTIAGLEDRLAKATPIVRCMPNTPALLRAGATALYANEAATDRHRALAIGIVGAVGATCWVEREELLDAVTALSGSGPAYFFLFMEAMVAAGESLGLDLETSQALVIQTGVGAARMAAEGDVGLAELRRRVTSPGGTTERALQSFADADLRGAVAEAIRSAAERAEEMGREMAEE